MATKLTRKPIRKNSPTVRKTERALRTYKVRGIGHVQNVTADSPRSALAYVQRNIALRSLMVNATATLLR